MRRARLLVAALLLLAAGACASPQPAPGSGLGAAPRPPAVRQAELWYATDPAPGVWAELKVVLDNPQVLEAQRTVLHFPAALLEDFALRDAEPPLLGPPVQEPDGRYAFVFPPPLDRSHNWYRLFLAARRASPRPVQVAISIERARADGVAGAPGGAEARIDVLPVVPKTRYVDRAADPFWVVPEGAVAWLPSRPRSVLPFAAVMATLLTATAAAGCLAAFWLQRR